MFREGFFDKSVVKVERKDDAMYLYEENNTDLILPFPSHLFPDKQERKAVLMYLTCEESVAYMHQSIKALLKGKLDPTNLEPLMQKWALR